MSRVNVQLEVDKEDGVGIPSEIKYGEWSMQQKCGRQEGIVHAGSWSRHSDSG